MSRQLFIYLGPTAPDEVSWPPRTAREGCGAAAARWRSFPDPGRAAGVLVPGPDVLVTEVAIPGGRNRLYAAEPALSSGRKFGREVEDIHFASGPASPGRQGGGGGGQPGAANKWLTMLSESRLASGGVLTPATLAYRSPSASGPWWLPGAGFWPAWAGGSSPGKPHLEHYLAGETRWRPRPKPHQRVEVLNCSGQEFFPAAGWAESSRPPAAQLMQVPAEGFAARVQHQPAQGEFAGNAHWRRPAALAGGARSPPPPSSC